MATELCQKCKQSHPGRLCDYSDKGDCAETVASTETPNPPPRNSRKKDGRKEAIGPWKTQTKANPEFKVADAEANIRSAHEILKALQKKIGEHPEVGAAITKLEMALNDLAIQTGCLL
jgi:hypothetical protein